MEAWSVLSGTQQTFLLLASIARPWWNLKTFNHWSLAAVLHTFFPYCTDLLWNDLRTWRVSACWWSGKGHTDIESATRPNSPRARTRVMPTIGSIDFVFRNLDNRSHKFSSLIACVCNPCGLQLIISSPAVTKCHLQTILVRGVGWRSV